MNDIIWRAYEKSIDPNAPTNERNEALKVCEDFKSNPDVCIPLAVQWAQCSDAKTCFFGLHCIEHVIKSRWSKIPVDFQRALRHSVVELLKTKRSEAYLSTMLSRCLSHIIIRDWPQSWPDMFNELESLGEVTALKIFLEEVYLYDSIPTSRRRELTQAIQSNLLPVLFPQLLSVLQNDNSSDDQVSLVLSILLPISHTCPDPSILLISLTKHVLNASNRKAVIDCIQKLLRSGSGRKNLPVVDSLLPIIYKIIPSSDEDTELMDDFASLLFCIYSYDQDKFKQALGCCDILKKILISEDYALEFTDSYFNLMSMLCDCLSQICIDYEENLTYLLATSLKLAIKPIGRNADVDESRNISRIRSAAQKFCMSMALIKPDIFMAKLSKEINNAQWDSASFMLQSTESNNVNAPLIQEVINNLYKSETHQHNETDRSMTNFLQLAFKHASLMLQSKMLIDLINGNDEQSGMSSLLSLTRDPCCQNSIRSQLPLLLNRLTSLQDCLAVSMMAEAILLLVKTDEVEVANVLSVILQPCTVIFDGNYDQSKLQSYSIALHLLTSIARSLSDTAVGRSNLKQFIEPMIQLAHSSTNETFASKALEFLSACVSAASNNSEQLFIPDEAFAQLMLQNQQSRPELQRSLLRQIAMPLVTKEYHLYKDFIQLLLLNMPRIIENAYLKIPDDLSPEQDSEERQKLALLTRDLVELIRKVCQPEDYLEKFNFNIQLIIGMCFQSLYIFQDSVAIQRLIPVCTKFLKFFQSDMELPGLLCCLRSLKTYLQTDREVLGHDLTVLASQLFDKILNRLGIDATTELVQMQICAMIEKDDVLKYYEGVYNNDLNDKKRKKITEILFKKALQT